MVEKWQPPNNNKHPITITITNGDGEIKMNNVNKDIVEAILSERYPEFDRRTLNSFVYECQERSFEQVVHCVDKRIKDLLRPSQELSLHQNIFSVFRGLQREW